MQPRGRQFVDPLPQESKDVEAGCVRASETLNRLGLLSVDLTRGGEFGASSRLQERLLLLSMGKFLPNQKCRLPAPCRRQGIADVAERPEAFGHVAITRR